MKKLAIIAILVATLIGGLVGGTALAARTAAPVAAPVVMVADGGFLVVSENDTGQKMCSPVTPDYVHVSLTVTSRGLVDSGDEVWVMLSSKGGGPPGDQLIRINLLDSCSTNAAGAGTKTVEFDAGRGVTGVGPTAQNITWALYAKNPEGGSVDVFKLWWTYTMIYPSSTQNQQ